MERPKALVSANPGAASGVVSEALEGAGFAPTFVGSWAELEAALLRSAAVLVVMDATDGEHVVLEERVRRVARIRPGTMVVVLGGAPDGSDPEILMRAGALDVVREPGEFEGLRLAALRARRELRLLEELYRLRTGRGARVEEPALVGASPAIVRLRDELARLSGHDDPGWILGPPGSGRVHAARWVHRHSARSGGPFAVVNGRGSDAGAALFGDGARPGHLHGAASGTIVVEEAEALPPTAQEELAQQVRRGGIARVLATSSLDPAQSSDLGRLTPALSTALGDRAARVPALGERPEDVAPLARHFLRSICEVNDLPPLALAEGLLAALQSYRWPGNVAELRNAVEHAALVATAGEIVLDNLPRSLRNAIDRDSRRGGTSPRRPFRDAKNDVVRDFERQYLEDLLDRNAGNVTAASVESGMLRSALQRLLRKHRLRSSEFRRGFAGRRVHP